VLLADNLVKGLRPALAGYDSIGHDVSYLASGAVYLGGVS
jgi:hypothetical protein